MARKPKPKQEDLLDQELADTEIMIRKAIHQARVGAAEPESPGSQGSPGLERRAEGMVGREILPRRASQEAHPVLGDSGHETPSAPADRHVISGLRRSTRWIPLIVFGVPAVIMLIASYLATKGVYLDPLRSLWSPVPSDDTKWILGVLVVVVTLLIAFRSGRLKR